MSNYVPGYGLSGAKIMIVGEAPGADEDREGKPFVGAAGKLLRSSLAQVGIDVDMVYLTNICRYRPPNNKMRAWFNELGHPNQTVFAGLVELIAEIEAVQPNVVVACGNYPLWALTGKAQWRRVKNRDGSSSMDYTGISAWRGSILESHVVPGLKVIPTFHPSFINREGFDSYGIFLADLERVKRESEFPGVRPIARELILDPQGKDRWEIKDMLLSPKKIITYDIEYIGSKLLCVSFANNLDWAVSIKTSAPSDLEYVREILLSGLPLNAQNGIFDCSILEWWYKMPVIQALKYDTMLAAHAANPELPKGLDFLCSIHTDQPYYKDMVDWKLIEAGKQSPEILLEYNAIDSWVQHAVMLSQLDSDLNEPEVMQTFKFEMSMVKPLWDMSSRGVRIDRDKLDVFRGQLEEEIALRTTALHMVAGKPVNVKSTKQIADLLFNKLGLRPGKKNKTGPATDDKTLAEVQIRATNDTQRGVIRLIREIRERRDLISKFVEIQFDEDDRMRGHYNPAGTDTGRLASRKFYPTGTGGNQQNIPRNKTVRRMFIPEPGKIFGYADLERAESLVVAHITQDPEMLRVHGPGMDAHKELAKVLYELDSVDEVTSDQRYMGKQTRHAGNYMEGPRVFMVNVNKLAAKTGVSIDFTTAKKFIGIYRELHPFLERWWSDTESQLWKTRTLYNLVGPNGKGRKRIFHGHIRGLLPKAVAFVPQSTVGDTLNVGLLNLEGVQSEYMVYLDSWEQCLEWHHELLEYGYRSLMQVHDAVGFEVNEKDMDKALPIISRLMSIPLTVPKTLENFVIPVEIAVGPNWGDVEKWSPKSVPVEA
jgi:uracil-DNA glycosylase family 4